ncbi:MAG: hypothetical protein AAGA96_14025 [Verrucomicrobiota bacterium]
MKKLLIAAIAIFCLAGVAQAGCGKTTTDSGTLSSYDDDTKTLVVSVDGKDKKLTATSGMTVKDKDGNDIEIDSLIGKSVSVDSEHKKVSAVKAS